MNNPIDVARSLIGVPWKHQGRNRNVAIDCVGLLIIAFDTEDTTAYARDPANGALEARLKYHFGEPVGSSADDAQAGDVVLMRYGKVPRHVGIIANGIDGRLSLIHTDSNVGRVVEHALDEKWKRRVCGVYRL